MEICPVANYCKFAAMNFQEARKLTEEKLLPVLGEGEANAIAWELCLFVSKLERHDRYGQKRFQFDNVKLKTLSSFTDQILQGNPMQYVLGEAWFSGLRLIVSPAVLIPRPETEELVEWVISYCRFPVENLQIVDAGTGSGCIAIALKKRIRKAEVIGIDISREALEIAEKNAHDLSIDVLFREADILDRSAFSTWPSFDILISNPPYVQLAERSAMELRVAAHEPALALFVSDEDPLCHYNALGELLIVKGNVGAQLFCEMNAQLAEQTEALFQRRGLKTEIKKDMQGKSRMIRVYR